MCKNLIYLTLSFLLNPALFPQASLNAAEQEKPRNIVFILADDMGWADVSVNASPPWETPRIDRLAEEGMRFPQAYAASPVCSATRAGILTGQYPHRLHFTGITPHMAGGTQYKVPENAEVLGGFMKLTLPEDTQTFAHDFQKAGYRTGFIGKWHIGGEEEQVRQFGFDDVYYFDPTNYAGAKHDGEFLTDAKGDKAVEYITQHKDAPFLLYLSLNAVHTPIRATREMEQRYLDEGLPKDGPWNAAYAAFVQHIDENVGKIVDKLEELGLSENTLVVFFSDNGGRGIHISKNDPLRGGKGELSEGGIREPFIAYLPGVIPAGSVNDTPVISTDLYPTFLEAAGLPLKPEHHVDGVSLWPLFQDPAASRDRELLYWHHPHYSTTAVPHSAVRRGDWKFIRYDTAYRRVWDADKQEVVELQDAPRKELFNLAEDISETQNLVDAQSQIAGELEDLLNTHLEKTDAQMPEKNPDHDSEQPISGVFITD